MKWVTIFLYKGTVTVNIVRIYSNKERVMFCLLGTKFFLIIQTKQRCLTGCDYVMVIRVSLGNNVVRQLDVKLRRDGGQKADNKTKVF